MIERATNIVFIKLCNVPNSHAPQTMKTFGGALKASAVSSPASIGALAVPLKWQWQLRSREAHFKVGHFIFRKAAGLKWSMR